MATFVIIDFLSFFSVRLIGVMEEKLTTTKHRPWESGESKSLSGEGVVGSPTSLAEIFDTAFASSVDRPHNDECAASKFM